MILMKPAMTTTTDLSEMIQLYKYTDGYGYVHQVRVLGKESGRINVCERVKDGVKVYLHDQQITPVADTAA